MTRARPHLTLVSDRRPSDLPERPPPVALYIAGIVAVSWFAAVGVVWTAYAVCRMTGLTR